MLWSMPPRDPVAGRVGAVGPADGGRAARCCPASHGLVPVSSFSSGSRKH